MTLIAALLMALPTQEEPAPPWRSGLDVTRKAALREGKPCVLLLQLQARAL